MSIIALQYSENYLNIHFEYKNDERLDKKATNFLVKLQDENGKINSTVSIGIFIGILIWTFEKSFKF
jgi:hypothetical protein